MLLEQVDVVLDLHRCGNPTSDACLRRLVGWSRFPDTPRTLVYEWTPGTPNFRRVDDPMLVRLREHWEAVRAVLVARSAAVTHKELLADWPRERLPPSASQLYEWLGRAADEGWVQRIGQGTRNDPFRFRLPDLNERTEVSPLPPMNQDG